jgi:type I restriction enzyme S subunit
MDYKKIGDLTNVITGGTPSTTKNKYWENGDIPWLQSGCCQNCDVEFAEKYITQEGYNNSSTKIMPKNSVMIALTGATAGKIGYLNFEACGNQSITGIVPCELLNQRYLFYYLLSQREKILADCIGGAQPHISQGYVKNIQVPMLPLEKQQKIVDILSRLSAIIKKRQDEIRLFDDLIKARFVELFGDPVHNPHGWDKLELKALADLKIGPFGSLLHKEDYIEDGHALVNPSHIVDGRISIDPKLTVSEEKYEELFAYHLKVGDVVMGRRGEMGRCAVVEEEGLLCGTGSLLIRPKGKVTADYIQKIISYPTFKKTIEDMAVGQTMPNLNVPIVSGFKIITPPIEVQNSYYAFVAQVDKSKVAVQKALDETQLLFDSLMQEYFG